VTIVIPTRNRPEQCRALVNFMRRQDVVHRISIADSSDEAHALALRRACGETTQIISFPPEISPVEKLAAAITAVETPFVALVPDDDITFPHAIDRCLDHLVRHPKATAAQGYAINGVIKPHTFDLLRVRWFTPSISDDDPLRRLYQLIRRYQPIFWAVFRRDVLLIALRRSCSQGLAILQEMTVAETVVLLGTVARLPCIYTLRLPGPSQTRLEQRHPFFALLADSGGFFAHYHAYLEDLVTFIQRDNMTSLPPARLRHVLNLMHAIYFRGELDGGMMEHAVQSLLDPSFPPMTLPPTAHADRPASGRDRTTKSKRTGNYYVWRHEFLEAEPREEITITTAERERVASALDDYDMDVV
jgi:glycosyltransferase domain-containing protein